MKRQLLAVMVAASLSSFAGIACAGPFDSLTSAIPGVGSSGGSVSPDSIVSKYIAGSVSVNNADVKMLRAVGLKDEADRAELQAKNLTEGATQEALEASAKSQTESSKALEAKFTSGKMKMDAQSKAQFAAGMVDLGKGVLQYVAMSKEIAGFKPSPAAIGGSTLSAVYIVKNLPDSILSLVSTLKSSVSFAKANNIPVPKEAADATSAI